MSALDAMTAWGSLMHMVVVIRQLSAVLDELLARETRELRLTPEDVLLLGWIVQQPGIGAARLAERIGRQRQSVQRTLERLEERQIVERYAASVRKRAAGWGLTSLGQTCWEELERAFRTQDRQLERHGVDLQHWTRALEDLLRAARGVMRPPPFQSLMVVPPPEADEVPMIDWDH